MKKSLSVILFCLIIFSFFSILFSTHFVLAQGLVAEPTWKGVVPCGRNVGTAEEQSKCTLCHLIVGINRIFTYGVYIVIAVCFVAIFGAGILYIVSTGDPGMMESAKKFLVSAVVGFALVGGAWLIVNVSLWAMAVKGESDPGGGLGVQKTSWFNFTCSTVSSTAVSQKYKCISTATTKSCVPAQDGTYDTEGDCLRKSECAPASQKWKCDMGSKKCVAGTEGPFTDEATCVANTECRQSAVPSTCDSKGGVCAASCETGVQKIDGIFSDCVAPKSTCCAAGAPISTNCNQEIGAICIDRVFGLCPENYSAAPSVDPGRECSNGLKCCYKNKPEGFQCDKHVLSAKCMQTSYLMCPTGYTSVSFSTYNCDSGLECCTPQ